MKLYLKRFSIFLTIAFCFFFCCTLLIGLFSKNELHLFLNQFHTPLLDVFFKYLTHIGDGISPAIVLPIALLFYRKNLLGNFSVAAFTFMLVPVTVQYLKRGVFYQSPRPIRVLGEEALYLVPDVEIAQIYTFPSGHATAIFALFITLSYIFRTRKKLQYAFAFLAVLGAYSRVYLSQHFVQDIFAGSILGITCFTVAYFVVGLPLERRYAKKQADQPR